jgi:hypothetical protein
MQHGVTLILDCIEIAKSYDDLRTIITHDNLQGRTHTHMVVTVEREI